MLCIQQQEAVQIARKGFRSRMILYTEKQLEECYKAYKRFQITNDQPFVTLEDFRILLEYILDTFYKDEE